MEHSQEDPPEQKKKCINSKHPKPSQHEPTLSEL